MRITLGGRVNRNYPTLGGRCKLKSDLPWVAVVNLKSDLPWVAVVNRNLIYLGWPLCKLKSDVRWVMV